MPIINLDNDYDEILPNVNPEVTDYDTSPKPILPNVNNIVKPDRGTGHEGDGLYGFDDYSSKNNILSSIGNAAKYIIGGSGLGMAYNDIKSDLYSTYNDVKSMIADPRYAVYKGVELLKNAINGEFSPQDRIHPDLNPSNGNAVLGKTLNMVTKLDPTGGMLSTLAANKLKSLSKSVGIDDEDWLARMLEQYRYRRDLKYSEVTDAIQLADFSSEEPGMPNKFRESPANRDIFYSSMHGYKTVQGISIGTNYLWDFTLDNYNPKLWGINGQQVEHRTFAPKVPSNDKANKSEGSLGNFIPAISFDFRDYTTLTSQVELANEATIELIAGIKRQNRLSVTILDDENFTWQRYFNTYMRSIYDIESNCVAPYKQSVLLANIALYNPLNKVYFRHKLLVIPVDFEQRVTGEDSPSPAELEVEFSVVGDIK